MDSAAKLFAHSPFLSRLAKAYPQVLQQKADACLAEIIADLRMQNAAALTPSHLMPLLRRAKAKVALLVATADLSGEWGLAQVTRALSDFADAALQLAVDALLAQAAGRGEITLAGSSGLIILGMGKLGAYELNYSSDIDLIIFYEPGRLQYRGRESEQRFFNRLAHALVQAMQERTADGYVFRTDIRLRPDPASTPPAITVGAAIAYYESVGQNWERAAMIKARPVAGDIAAGEEFLRMLSPFLWRRNLDFAAIQDIHSIKRQMDGRGKNTISLAGHNIKLGAGGIREIEFFTQIHQLIWGGRQTELRRRGTCEALSALVKCGLVETGVAETLAGAYTLLRTLEHRLQMVDDQQTHTLPESAEELQRIAALMGVGSVEALERAVLPALQEVHEIFASSFRSSENLGGEGALVFTGVSHDEDTLETLRNMGYAYPPRVSEIVMGWHHGSHRSTRTKRAREMLTEMMPALLSRLAKTADPDAAFLKFDEFLARVPVGAQLFSLFAANPELLGLIADIMGSAPVLADTLARHPDLLDSVLYSDFYGKLPQREALAAQLDDMLAHTQDFEAQMEMLRRFKNEKQFQGGVQLLKGVADARTCAHFLTRLAEVMLARTLAIVEAEFSTVYGIIPGGRFAVLALGRLGAGEMAFGSDIDVVFAYDADADASSDGKKPLNASVYYNRLTQRLHNALAAMGREGRLYEADMRLRPSGAQGLAAITLDALAQYFDALAWTFEFMALTKARAVAGDTSLMQALGALVNVQLRKVRDVESLRADVADMRGRVAKEFPPHDVWDLKHARGGLMEVDFICQYMLLRHAADVPDILVRESGAQLLRLSEAGLLAPLPAEELLRAHAFLDRLFHIMRLSTGGEFDEAGAMPGLKHLLAASMGAADFAALKAALLEVEKIVHLHYMEILGN